VRGLRKTAQWFADSWCGFSFSLLYLRILAPFKGLNCLAIWQNTADVWSGRSDRAVCRQQSVVL
jgi:hypothetical protein